MASGASSAKNRLAWNGVWGMIGEKIGFSTAFTESSWPATISMRQTIHSAAMVARANTIASRKAGINGHLNAMMTTTGIAGARYEIHGTRTRGAAVATPTAEARRTSTPRRFHHDMA